MHHLETIDSLRRTGYRLTPQRVMILQAIAEGAESHMTAEEVHHRVQRDYPYIDIATVYRTLQLLKRLHLVTEIDLGEGPTRYELAGDGRHHHLICRGCGRAVDLPLTYLDGLRQSLRREFAFEPDLEHFALAGLCSACLLVPVKP